MSNSYILIPRADYMELYVEAKLSPDMKVTDTLLDNNVKYTFWIENNKLMLMKEGDAAAGTLYPIDGEGTELPSIRIKTPRGDLYRKFIEGGMDGISAYKLMTSLYAVFPPTHVFDGIAIKHFIDTFKADAETVVLDLPPFIEIPEEMMNAPAEVLNKKEE